MTKGDFTGYVDCMAIPIHIGDIVEVDENFGKIVGEVVFKGGKIKVKNRVIDKYEQYFTRVRNSVKYGVRVY